MPIISAPQEPPALPPNQKDPALKIVDPAYKHSLVDNKEAPFDSLMVFIAGMNWYVDYYSQILGSDEEVSAFQPEQQATYQQYALVKDFLLKLQSSLSPSYDSETQVANVTGTAVVFPPTRPNKGDVFIADIGDGRAGLFTVTSVQKLNYMKEACFQIEVEWTKLVSPQIAAALEQRTQKTSYFRKDFQIYGQNPIIASEELMDVVKMERYEMDLYRHWARMFYDPNQRTVLVPGQDSPTYDPFIVKAVFRMYDVTSDAWLAKARQLNVDGVQYMDQPDLWTAIVTCDKALLSSVFKNSQVVDSTVFPGQPSMDGIRWSGVKRVVTPAGRNGQVGYDYVPEDIAGGQLKPLYDMEIDLASAVFMNILNGLSLNDDDLAAAMAFVNNEIPAIHPVMADGSSYVLSSFFYNEASVGRSKLELLLTDYFNHADIQRPVLYTFCESAKQWGRLEQFYYIPLLLAMLRVTRRSI